MTQLNIHQRINYRGRLKGFTNDFFIGSFSAQFGILNVYLTPPNRYGLYYPQYGKGHCAYPGCKNPMNAKTSRRIWRNTDKKVVATIKLIRG